MVDLDAVKDRIDRVVDEHAAVLLDASHRIHARPELGFEEHHAHEVLTRVLADAGLTVTPGAYDLPTAFEAVAGTSGPRIAICCEYDALPVIGHACGHNVIGTAGVGAGIAAAAVAEELGGTVVVLGTPAEEGGGGKVVMLERGAFEGVHLALMAHPGPVDVARARPYAVSHLDIAYDGKAAHAAAYPEDGVNAADAFTVAQVAIGLLRQQLPSGARVHGLVTRQGEAPNAIPQRSEGRWYVRGDSTGLMETTREKVLRCFEAGAIATGCELHVDEPTAPYAEMRTDDDVLALYVRNAGGLGRTFSDGDTGLGRMSRASTDMGNVSQVVAAIHPYIGIASAPAVNHQREFAAACVTPAADAALLDAATALALTVVDAATDDAVRTRLLA